MATRRHYETLAALFDATTFRHIDRLGIDAGWHCWEVGTGGPSVPRWLSGRVGPTGRVLATDIDVSSLPDTADSPVPERPYEVRRHDVAAEPPPPEGFDLVHARLVLVHVPDRDAALAAMARAVRPGGWLFVEDADQSMQPLACPDEVGPAQRLANKIRQAAWTLVSRQRPLAYGRTLPRLLREVGLAEVGADVSFALAGPDQAAPWQHMIERQRPHLLAAGLVTADEIERHLADIAAGHLDIATFPVVSAWGQKPVTGRPPGCADGRGPGEREG